MVDREQTLARLEELYRIETRGYRSSAWRKLNRFVTEDLAVEAEKNRMERLKQLGNAPYGA